MAERDTDPPFVDPIPDEPDPTGRSADLGPASAFPRRVRAWTTSATVTLVGLVVLAVVVLGRRAAPALEAPILYIGALGVTLAGLVASCAAAIRVGRGSPEREGFQAFAASVALALAVAVTGFVIFVAVRTFDHLWVGGECRPDPSGVQICSEYVGPLLLGLGGLATWALWLLALVLLGGTLRARAKSVGMIPVARLTRWAWGALFLAAAATTWLFATVGKKPGDGSAAPVRFEVFIALAGVAATVALSLVVARRVGARATPSRSGQRGAARRA